MEYKIEEIKESIFGQYMDQEHLIFLSNFYENKKNWFDDLKRIEQKKEDVLEKISEDKKLIENDPRELRDYINDSESVLESVVRIYNSTNEIINQYRNIEKSFMIIEKKSELGLEKYSLQEDMHSLSNMVDLIKGLETNTRIDNERNYVIVDSFLSKILKYEFNNKEEVAFSDLTIDNLKDNLELRIYEKRVELPYTKEEIKKFLETYPDNYKTVQDVISKEFIEHISLFTKHPILSRFKEAYYLCRTKEMMSIFESFNYAKSIMFRSDINAYIIAAVKSKKQLEDYIECLDNNELNKYKHFKIIFNINPLISNKYNQHSY